MESRGAPLRLVTHHWSDNMSKGFELYSQIDEAIASGALSEAELWVIGRWPQKIRGKARTFPPCVGEAGRTAASVPCVRHRVEARARRDASGRRAAVRASPAL